MTYGFKIIEELVEGLEQWMDSAGHANLDSIHGRAVPNVTEWQYLNLNYTTKARIDQDSCIKWAVVILREDTSHQAITNMVDGERRFEVIDEECVGCNSSMCVQSKTASQWADSGRRSRQEDRQRRAIGYGNWTMHPNNPMSDAAE